MINNNMTCKNNMIAFGAQIKPTKTLERLFEDVRFGEFAPKQNYEIARSIESILTDGTDDIVEITKENKKSTTFAAQIPYIVAKVNGKQICESGIYAIDNRRLTGRTIYQVLISCAQKLNPTLDFESLTKQDHRVIEPQMKELSELVKNNKDVPAKLLEKTKALTAIMDKKIVRNALDNLYKSETEIFK